MFIKIKAGIFKSCRPFSNKVSKSLLEKLDKSKIRNFCIVAHVDHGKSTLADRLLELTGTMARVEGKSQEQVLDTLQVERDRGITVKAQTATMLHTYKNNEYILNLIDTPGHVDFSYQVSRSIRACQGALLIIDATAGIQAQTISNFYQAFDAGLSIIPVINKIDLVSANVEKTVAQIVQQFDFKESEILKISAKTGIGLDGVMSALITQIPSPPGDLKKPFRALLFDAKYLPNKGVLCLIAVIDGFLRTDDTLVSYNTGKRFGIFEIGIVNPMQVPTDYLGPGQVGYVISNMKSVVDAQIGDTFFTAKHVRDDIVAFPGFQKPKPTVFAGLYPEDSDDYEDLEKALKKLLLADGSVTFQYESSGALGNGFRCGFLGMLHMDVFRQRLENEHDQLVIITSPSVPYEVVTKKGERMRVENAIMAPPYEEISHWEEMIVDANIICPQEYEGGIMNLCTGKRGIQVARDNIDEKMLLLRYEIPLAEIITDFFDKLKSLSSGYASFDYEMKEYRPADIRIVK